MLCVSYSETLYEDERFRSRDLAAVVASKVFYHLEELDDALKYALGAGELFDISEKNEYVETLLAKCIDEYIAQRQQTAKAGRDGKQPIALPSATDDSKEQSAASAASAPSPPLDPRLVTVVERMFARCYEDGQYHQALGIAIESRRLDQVKQSILLSPDTKAMLSYAYQLSQTLVLSHSFRRSLLQTLVQLYEGEGVTDFLNVCQCLLFLDDSDKVASILNELISKDEEAGGGSAAGALMAYQIAFDLSENQNQPFLNRVAKALPSPDQPAAAASAAAAGAAATSTDASASAAPATASSSSSSSSTAMDTSSDATSTASRPASSAPSASSSSADVIDSDPSSDSYAVRLRRLRSILSGRTGTDHYLHFLYEHNRTDLNILKQIKDKLEPRNSVTHNATVMTHAIMHCFPARDTRVLTDHGLLFLDELEERLRAGQRVLYACYDRQSKALQYRTGRLMLPPPADYAQLLEFSAPEEAGRWEAGSEPSAADSVDSSHLSLRVTSEHVMLVQHGLEHSSGSGQVAWSRRPAERQLASSLLSPCSCAPHLLCLHRRRSVRMLACAEAGHAVSKAAEPLRVQQSIGLSDEQLAPFLELLGFWLGNGSLHHRSALHGCDAVLMQQLKQSDAVWLESILPLCGLETSDWKQGSSGELLVLRASWFDWFNREFLSSSAVSDDDDAPQPRPSFASRPRSKRSRNSGRSVTPPLEPLLAQTGEAVQEEELEDSAADQAEQSVDDQLTSVPSKSVQHRLPRWLLLQLSPQRLFLVIRGLWRAAGSWETQQQRIFTSCAVFRDQLVQALLHCGLSAHAALQHRAGTLLGYQRQGDAADGERYSASHVSSLSEEEQQSFSAVHAAVDAWYVSWAAPDSSEGQAACWPTLRRQSGISSQRYSAACDGRIWCVQVEHGDHLILAQRAQRDSGGVVRRQSRPVVVGNCGTTVDSFLRENLEWLAKAQNWAKFTATASIGVIHKGHVKESLKLLEPYLPSGGQSGGSPYQEGGALYALGLVHSSHGSEQVEYLTEALRNAGNNEIVQHGACLGLGLCAMASGSDSLFEILKNVVMSESAVAGEAAGYAMGLVQLGSGNGLAVEEMIAYAHDTQHEKIIRGLSMGIAMIVYGREEEADVIIEQLCADKDPILRYGAMYAIGLAYACTANNAAIRRLLHIAVSDVSDDVRRAAVTCLGFVLANMPEQVPRVVNLLAASYNPHVRYGAALAVGIACAGGATERIRKEALSVLEPLLKDRVDFVRQGAFIGLSMLLIQHNEKSEPKLALLRKSIGDAMNIKSDTMTKLGAILAAGIVDAGGRNVSISLLSSSGHKKQAAIVGLALFPQFWYWYPLVHFLSLAFSPTAVIGLNRNLDLPQGFTFVSRAPASAFAYPPPVELEKKEVKKEVKHATLSVTAKAKAKQRRKEEDDKKGDEDKMDVDDDAADEKTANASAAAAVPPAAAAAASAAGEAEEKKEPASTSTAMETSESKEEKKEDDASTAAASAAAASSAAPAAAQPDDSKAASVAAPPAEAEQKAEAKDEKETKDVKEQRELPFQVLSNPARVTLPQLATLTWPRQQRYRPVKSQLSGFVLLEDTQPSQQEQLVKGKTPKLGVPGVSDDEPEPPKPFEYSGS